MFTVAIVADEERKHLSAALPRAEFRSKGFGDAKSFLDEVDDLNPDVVLLDLTAPNFDGVEVLREVRGFLPLHVPVIVITEDGSEDATREAVESGAVATLQKPVDRASLLELLRSALGGTPP